MIPHDPPRGLYATMPAEARQTAAQKVRHTFAEMGKPDGNSDIEMMMATLATAMEGRLAGELEQQQRDGQLDRLVIALTRWVAWHRSDHLGRIAVVVMPLRQLPPGKRLDLLDHALRNVAPPDLPF